MRELKIECQTATLAKRLIETKETADLVYSIALIASKQGTGLWNAPNDMAYLKALSDELNKRLPVKP